MTSISKKIPKAGKDVSWEKAYKKTLANLERAYERLRETKDVKADLDAIQAELAQANESIEILRMIVYYLESKLDI